MISLLIDLCGCCCRLKPITGYVLSLQWQISAMYGRAVGSIPEVTVFTTGVTKIL